MSSNRKIRHRFNELYHELKAQNGKLTLTNISEDTGISQPYLSNIKNNPHAKLSMNTIERLCNFLQVSPGELLVIEGENGTKCGNLPVEPIQPYQNSQLTKLIREVVREEVAPLYKIIKDASIIS